MSTPEFDVAIRGAGPVGTTLALMLARSAPAPERIALIGPLRTGAEPLTHDPRTLALNHGSQQTLRSINGWPEQAAAIHTVHVSQAGRLGRTLISPEELGVPMLGHVAGYDAVVQKLHHAVIESGVTCLPEAGHIHLPGHTSGSDTATSKAVDTTDIRSRLYVQSDGQRPTGLVRKYNQHGLLAMVRAGQPKPGWAFERFTREGPLALLPHPAGSDIMSLVWCCSPQVARERAALAPADFARILQSHFSDRLGRFTLLNTPAVYPLELHAGPTRLGARRLVIGNAAQTLHPVAGQGLNLGLRDAARLAQTLMPWIANTARDPEPFISRFVEQRQPDRWLTATITDTLPRIFTTRNPLVEHGCGLALLSLDLVPAARRPLARHLLQGLRL